jgi:Raf kinase inhibitor-like YbhB/YbcL family protein
MHIPYCPIGMSARCAMTGRLIVGLMLWSLTCAAAGPTAFRVTSSSFTEGETIPNRFGADICGGGGTSLQVSWSGVPATAKSMVVLLIDADGAAGLTVPHWLVYNLLPSRGELREGEAQGPKADITLGTNVSGQQAYRGMCPPTGDWPHHYYLSVIATDIAPGALKPGLSEPELRAALRGHALIAQSYFGRYQR